MCDRIKKRRLELNMSQEELALKVGYKSRSAINKIELGKIGIQQEKVEKFADALETTVEYLQGHIDDPDFPHTDLERIMRRADEFRIMYNQKRGIWEKRLSYQPDDIAIEISLADDSLIDTIHNICGLDYSVNVTMSDVRKIELIQNFIQDNENTLRRMMEFIEE